VSKHADLANRIFRTVVFSGAMLGSAVPAMADAPVPPRQAKPVESKPAPPKPDTWDTVDKAIAATDKQIDAAVIDYAAALKAAAAREEGSGTMMALASSKLDGLRKARAELVERLAKTTRPPFVNVKVAPAVETAEAAYAAATTRLFASLDAVSAAQQDAEMKKAMGQADAARKTRVLAAAKVKAARTKANKRPRAPESERPTGRGFVLS